MTADQAKQLAFVTGLTLVAGTIINGAVVTSGDLYKAGTSTTGKGVGTNLAKAGGQLQPFRYFPRFAAIAIAWLILAVAADQIPEVVGPLALLILVAYVFHEAAYFKVYYTNLGK